MITIYWLKYLISIDSGFKIIDTEEIKDEGNQSMKDRKLEEQNQVNNKKFNIAGNSV